MHSFNKLMNWEGRDAVAMVSNDLQQIQQSKLEAASLNEGSNQKTYIQLPWQGNTLVHLLTLISER